MSISGKIAIVTGGAQGIGKAIATRFLQEGARVVIAEIDEEAGNETGQELEHLGEVHFVRTDVASEKDVKNMIGRTVEQFGSIDILVNNASIMMYHPISQLPLEEWNRVIGVNLTGMFLCSKYAAPHLAQNRGVIINIASTRAIMSEPDTEAYSASKGGVMGLTHSLSVSLGPEVRVNSISPGWIEVREWRKSRYRILPDLSEADHAQHPAGRVGDPMDVANAALFLASPENSFITGENIVVDGGMVRKMTYL